MKQGIAILFVVLTLLGMSNAGAQVVPPTPTNLTAQVVSLNTLEIRLLWQAPTGPWRFRVYRSVGDSIHFAPLSTTGMREFHDRNIWPGHTYYYRVTSYTTDLPMLESPPSNIAFATLGNPTPRVRGTIAGTVIDDSTTLPIPHVRIRFFRFSPNMTMTPYVFTDSLGNYRALLDTGTYIVKAEPLCPSTTLCYRPEFYDNSPYPQGATPIAVAESSLFVANFGLSRPTPPTYANISGRVTDTLGVPLRYASVAIMRTLQEMNYLAATSGQTPGLGMESMDLVGVGHTRGVMWRGWTDSLGNYTARVVSGRSYIALASKMGFLPEYFDNKTNPMEADVIPLVGDTTGIDFSLSPNPLYQNSISGIVRDSLGVRVPSRIVLFPVNRPALNTTRFYHTDSLGEYTITGVRTGDYFVLAVPFSDYAPAFYKEGEYGVTHWTDADTVEIVGNVTGINVGVVPIQSNGIAQVRGQVRSTTGNPLAGVIVVAMSTDNMVLGVGVTDRLGAYAIDAVAAGSVSVIADHEGYTGTTTTVNIGGGVTTVSGIDFTLTPTILTSSGDDTPVAQRYALEQNYPNPFNPTTNIQFTLPNNGFVTVKVFNLLGQEVATLVEGTLKSGSHVVAWNGADTKGEFVATGVYFYKIAASLPAGGEFVQIRKMVLLR